MVALSPSQAVAQDPLSMSNIRSRSCVCIQAQIYWYMARQSKTFLIVALADPQRMMGAILMGFEYKCASTICPLTQESYFDVIAYHLLPPIV